MAMRSVLDYRKQIESALRYSGGTHTFADVQAMVLTGKAQFWHGVESVVITQIEVTPQLRNLHFFLAAGNQQELALMEAPLCEWGRLQGCTTATLIGRKGWERSFLTKTGWTPTHTVFGKEL